MHASVEPMSDSPPAEDPASPYRSLATPAADAAIPRELVLASNAGGTFLKSTASLLFFLGAAAIFAIAADAPAIFYIAAAFALFRFFSRSRAPQLRFQVQGDRVSVFSRKKAPMLEVDIADILEVVRDDKEIERTMLGPGMTIAEKTTDLRATGKSNESRIAFELRSEHATEQRRVYLFETRLPGIEIDDWYPKIRGFLRKNGWIPASEIS